MAAVRRIALELRLPPGLCVQGDTRRAKQVLLNLAGNAIKYSREGSHVALSAGSQISTGPWAAVQDRGAGLTPEQLGRPFKPFERLGQERGPGEGTGLELALSVRLTEAMGGRIDVTSEVGHGTLFTVTWQRCQDDRAASTAPITSGPH